MTTATTETSAACYYAANVAAQHGWSVTATRLYEDYFEWCESNGVNPSALPTFAREHASLGVKKEKIAGRVRYLGIALKSELAVEAN